MGNPRARSESLDVADSATRWAKMEMPVHEDVDLRQERPDARREIADPERVLEETNGSDEPAGAQTIHRAHRLGVGIKVVLEPEQVPADALVRARSKWGLFEAVAVQNANALAVGALPIEKPTVGLELRAGAEQAFGVVVALDVHDMAALGSPAFAKRDEPGHEVRLDPARLAAVRVEDIAVQNDELGVVGSLWEALEQALVLARAYRPAEVEVGEEEGVVYTHDAAGSIGREGYHERGVWGR